jgi:hypothetical protein
VSAKYDTFRRNLDGNLHALEKHLDKEEAEQACEFCEGPREECECDSEYERAKFDALQEDAWEASNDD